MSAARNSSAQGQRAGSCKVTRRTERVSRPGKIPQQLRKFSTVDRFAVETETADEAGSWTWVMTLSPTLSPLAPKRPQRKWFKSRRIGVVKDALDLRVTAVVCFDLGRGAAQPRRSVMKAWSEKSGRRSAGCLASAGPAVQ